MMADVRLSELAALSGGELRGEDTAFGGVCTDSRRVGAAELFVALAGERHDGHDFVAAAGAAGAAAALVQHPVDVPLPQVCVTDTVRAMGLLARQQRALFRGPVVAVTGSCGKTGVRNMAQAILARAGNTLASEANFNNEIGVPLTLFRLEQGHEFAVVEMGATRAGDIGWLCEVAAPTVAGVLNVRPAHLEGFGSIEGIAAAKGEIYDHLRSDDTAVINVDEPWLGQWRERAAPARIVTFGTHRDADVRACAVDDRGIAGTRFELHTPQGTAAVILPLPGVHNVGNALAAAALTLPCGVTVSQIASALAELKPVPGRLSVTRTATGATLIDDSYNASPGAVKAAIDLLAACPAPRTLVLGTMRELGERSAELHREVGDYARRAGVEGLWGVGEALRPAVTAFGAGGRYFPDTAAAIAACDDLLAPGRTVLVKGSRSVGMEAVFAALAGRDNPAEGKPCS